MSAVRRLATVADGLSRRLAQALTALSALAVVAIVLVLVFSSGQRYLLASPIPATEEIAAYLFVVLSFSSVVGGFVQGRHIRVLPLWQRLPPRLQGWMLLAGHLAAAAVLLLLVKQTFDFAWSSRAFGARSYVADMLEWPWMMVIPASLSLLALTILLRALVDFDRILRGEAPPEARRESAGEEL